MLRAWAGTAVVTPRSRRADCTAVAPPVPFRLDVGRDPGFSLAAVFVVAQVIDLVGAPFNVTSVSACGIVLAAATLAVVAQDRARAARGRGPAPHRRQRNLPTPDDTVDPRPGTRRPPSSSAACAFGMLLSGIAGGLLIFAVGIGGNGRVPPEVDASNHGFFVARVIHSESVDVSKVVVSDPSAAHGSASFYPLGTHASAAIAVRLSGADVGRVLVAFDIVFACIVSAAGHVLPRPRPRAPTTADRRLSPRSRFPHSSCSRPRRSATATCRSSWAWRSCPSPS